MTTPVNPPRTGGSPTGTDSDLGTATDDAMTTSRKRATPGGARGTATLARWGTRALVALALGGVLGAGAGVFTVYRLEPGRGTGVDSLAVMLDSIARGNVPAASAPPAPARVDSPAVEPPAPAPLVTVPALEGLEEGAARNALLDAGLTVGEIEFRASTRPAGTVLASVPAAGAQLAADAPVTLVLSDGRSSPSDTVSTPASSSSDLPS